MNYFNGSTLIVFALAIPLFSAIPLGMFGNMTTSPLTGDQGGYEVSIKKEAGRLSGTIVIAAGEIGSPLPLKNVMCDDAGSSCSFTFTNGTIAQSATLTRFGKIAIFAVKKERSHLLFERGIFAELPRADRGAFAEGPAYERQDKSKLAVKLAPETMVRLIGYENDPVYMACVEYNGKKLYVEINNFRETHPEAVTGDNVRFREKPSLDGAIIATLAKGTIVGRMSTLNEKWVRVSYGGKRGYIAAEFVTGY